MVTPNTSNPFNLSVQLRTLQTIQIELNPSNTSGLSHKLKEIDFNALECVGRSRNRTARIAQVVIRVERLGYSEWIEWVERVEMLR